MTDLLFSSMIGAGAGIIGTGIGGTIAFVLNKPSNRFLGILMSFSAGLMIAVVCFDLLPESFSIGSVYLGICGVVLGAFTILLCEDIIGRYRRARGNGKVKRSYVETGILIGIGIALHNFPEGLAIGSGFTALPSYGLGLSLVIALHDIPEGIAMATPMSIGGV
jgi:ZIP Zinc transporter.